MTDRPDTFILGIESSCDDTSAAVLQNDRILSNIISSQAIHGQFGGVVPELASRAHQQNIIPVVDTAIRKANIKKNQLHGVAYTLGPGLMGSLLVGTSFAKAFSLGMGIPLLEVDHLQAHILAHFIRSDPDSIVPSFPFLCLTVSGGHTQIVRIDNPFSMKIIGQTIDDAAGEAFDKVAKILGLPYPGGPVVDRLAKEGNPSAFSFAEPRIPGLDFSFSGLKTSFLYFLRDRLKDDPSFADNNRADLCASIQSLIVKILIDKLRLAGELTGIREIAIAGGVSANSALRAAVRELADQKKWKAFIPKFEFTTDNAAMIAMAGYVKYLKNDFGSRRAVPYARATW